MDAEWIRRQAERLLAETLNETDLGVFVAKAAAAIDGAVVSERARILNTLRNPTEEMQRIALNVQLPGPGEPPLWRKLLDAIAEHLEKAPAMESDDG